MKKVIILAALIALAPFGCKTHKAIQTSQVQKVATKIDSTNLHKEKVQKDSTSTEAKVQKEAKVVEEYSETNIVIHAPTDSRTVDVPGYLHLDSTSDLENLKFSNDKKPQTTLSISKEGNKAVARLQTPEGKQEFKNFSSIEINTKKWKKTTTGKVDSAAKEVVNKILKNSIDSGHKAVDSTHVVFKKETIVKDSKASFWGLLAGFWWIPATILAVVLLIWEWPSIINLFKKK